MAGITGTNKKDKRWWHIEKYLNGTKALIIGKFQLNWYHCDETKFSAKAYNNIDMFYCHIVLFHKCVELHYYYRL